MISKYGVYTYAETPEYNEKVRQTCLERYGVPSYTQTEEYKTRMASMYPEMQKKYKETCMKKYGVPNYSLTREFQKKSNETKLKNKSFNQSKPEERSYLFLKELYPDILRQYSSNEYPFACDFYIPSENLYIELNAHWTRGRHAFDPLNEDDLNKLKMWQSKNTEFYKNAIDTWTVHDLKKRQIAKQNNLNYLEFWSDDDLIIYFKKKENLIDSL